MRLGLFGGTFDPIHLGHLILAEACRETCKLERVRFVVAGEPPHKRGERTHASHRLEMARIAVAGHSAFEVDEIETQRPGPHYSVETVEAIRAQHPDDELCFLIGADVLAELDTWRSPERLVQMARLVVVNRPGNPPEPKSRFAFESVTIPHIGISSHDIRQRAGAGATIRYQVPRGVEMYIHEHGLYRRN